MMISESDQIKITALIQPRDEIKRIYNLKLNQDQILVDSVELFRN
jgi:hypothetical protein